MKGGVRHLSALDYLILNLLVSWNGGQAEVFDSRGVGRAPQCRVHYGLSCPALQPVWLIVSPARSAGLISCSRNQHALRLPTTSRPAATPGRVGARSRAVLVAFDLANIRARASPASGLLRAA